MKQLKVGYKDHALYIFISEYKYMLEELKLTVITYVLRIVDKRECRRMSRCKIMIKDKNKGKMKTKSK